MPRGAYAEVMGGLGQMEVFRDTHLPGIGHYGHT